MCLDPQAALPHAFRSGPNSSPCFPPQVGRNSPLHIPGLAPPRACTCTCPHAQTRTQTCAMCGRPMGSPRPGPVLNSLPEAEVSRRVTCEHGSRGLRGRGSLGGSTFGKKHLRAHNHLRGTSWDWRQGLSAQAFSAPIVTSPAQGHGFLWVPQPLRQSGWPWCAELQREWFWRPQTRCLRRWRGRRC